MLSYVAEEQTNVTDVTATVNSNEGGFMATAEVMATDDAPSPISVRCWTGSVFLAWQQHREREVAVESRQPSQVKAIFLRVDGDEGSHPCSKRSREKRTKERRIDLGLPLQSSVG